MALEDGAEITPRRGIAGLVDRLRGRTTRVGKEMKSPEVSDVPAYTRDPHKRDVAQAAKPVGERPVRHVASGNLDEPPSVREKRDASAGPKTS